MGAPGPLSFQERREPLSPAAPPTIAAAIDGALAKDHDVLGQGARLVGEDVLHLAQLLIQGGGAGLRRRPLLHAEHLLVPVDEVAVAQANDLHTAQGTGGKAWREGKGVPHPRRTLLQVLRLGRNGDRVTPGHGNLGGEGHGQPTGGANHIQPAQRPPTRPSDADPPDEKVQRVWAGGADSTGGGGRGAGDKELNQFLPQD